jgi:hypothetical protein
MALAGQAPEGSIVRGAGQLPDDVNMGNLEEFMTSFGLPGAGRLSKIESVESQGVSVEIPGGLQGDFTYADMMWLKANPIDPSTLPRDVHTGLQKKLSRSTSPKRSDLAGDRVETFNRYMFGMLSPNQPLTRNEFEFSVLRTRSPEDIDKLASYIDWEPGDSVPAAKRKAVNDQMSVDFNVQAKGKGGIGLKGSSDYTNLAEFAKLYKKNPDFFVKNADESWANFNERVMSQTRGLSSKVAAFSTVWQDPLEAAISAVDRHMARAFIPELFKTKKARLDWERGIVNRWNELIDKRNTLDAALDAGTIDQAAYKSEMRLIPKTTDPKQAKNLDDVLAQQGGEAVFMQRIMSMLGGKSAKFRNVKGEINPNVPEHLAQADWIVEPEKARIMSDAYKMAQVHNDKIAKEHGLGLFSSQWMEWDRIRRRLEPHEVMFPGLHKLPKMKEGDLKRAMQEHTAAGFGNSSKVPHLNPETGEVDMRLNPTRPMDINKSLYWSGAGAAVVANENNPYAKYAE